MNTTGFDFCCGAAYHTATPLRQARARLDYYRDWLGRVQSNPRRYVESRIPDHIAECRAGMQEALAAIAKEAQ